MKIILSFVFGVFFLVFLFALPKQVKAITTSFEPALENLDGSFGIVNMTITGASSGEYYTFCGNFYCESYLASSTQFTVPICGEVELDRELLAFFSECGADDYFHERSTYELQIYEGEAQPHRGIPENFNELNLIKEQRIYVKTYYPDVNVSKQGDQIVVSVSGLTKPGGAERNNYKIEFPLFAGNSERLNQDCLQIGSASGFNPANEGDYVIEIREQIDEGADPFSSACSGGFIYEKISFHIDENGNITNLKRVQDPEGRDRGGFGAGQNPCTAEGCETAFGNLSVDLSEFAQNALKVATGVAGGLAFILMVIGAIRVLTSSGDQQRLNGGREMIVAAVVGLLFIIFSVLILEFLGVNIIGLT
ncbi:hypothetical protein HY382_00435 [Candidatus Curtissbacteria bacterium]|nr:hypothetical protein [Candidatus Curtissbacteria bacterium]